MSARWQVCYQPDEAIDYMGAPVEVVSTHRFRLVAKVRAFFVGLNREPGMVWVQEVPR